MKNLIGLARRYAIESCQKEVERLVVKLGLFPIANVGGSTNNRIEGAYIVGSTGPSMLDFNTASLEVPNSFYRVVVCEQVIEHLHNTTWFLSELFRITAPHGRLILTTEGLTSFPNRLAMLFGLVPFSMQPCCGYYLGGFKSGTVNPGILTPNHPCYSGVTGHVRVMSQSQMKHLLNMCGWSLLLTRSWLFGHIVLYVASKDV